MEELAQPLVGAPWLRAHLEDPDLTILDVRWALPKGADQGSYLATHLPGARFVDLDQELAGPPGPAGRHPLPSAEQFTKAMQQAGVSKASRVVAYDGGSGSAARAWWLLRAAGHTQVAVLKGGLQSWIAFRGGVSAAETARLLASGAAVLDARSRERFRGAPSPLDPRPGHIPGAGSLPWTEAYRDGQVIADEELAARSAAATGGRRPAVAYCGSGVTACSLILALESAGIPGVQLYPGSWSEWARDPGRPAEVGD